MITVLLIHRIPQLAWYLGEKAGPFLTEKSRGLQSARPFTTVFREPGGSPPGSRVENDAAHKQPERQNVEAGLQIKALASR